MASRISLVRLLTVAWAAQIFWLSTDTFNSDQSRTLLDHLLALLNIHASPPVLSTINAIVRKLAHLVEYAILSILIYLSFQRSNVLRWQPVPARWCVVAAGLYALSDEFHQSFVPERGASLLDCGIDTAGAALGIAAVYCGARIVRQRSGVRDSDLDLYA